jgi:hypothetical protein
LPAATLGLVLLCGCEKSVPRTDYFPLRDGNRWEYRLLDMPLLKRLEAGHAVVTAPLEGEAAASRQEAPEGPPKAEIIDGLSPSDESSTRTSARRVAMELREGIDELTFKALYDTAEQVWSKKNGYVGFQSARGRSYLLILPPHTGYRWVVTGPGGQDLFFEIESAGAGVSTPAGTFKDCAVARQESRDRKEIFRYWFAPNVGLVRRSKYFVNEEVFRQELVEFNVKPATPATRIAEDREVARAVEGKNRGSEFRERTSDERWKRLEAIETPDEKRIDERVRKFSDPK